MPNHFNHADYAHSGVNFESQTYNILVYKRKFGLWFQPHLEQVMCLLK
jgi:hypothetical protein